MKRQLHRDVEEARRAALEVLHHNCRGPYHGLPRTAGWGYPEPYTRDLMIASLGVLVSGSDRLVRSLRRVLEVLARNQTPLGHVPSMVHDPENRGASDTTPLFLIGLAAYRRMSGQHAFLTTAARKALTWLDYQSPEDRVIVTQQPTTDWRDEQWVLGHGLFVNTLLYASLRLFGREAKAELLRELMNRFAVRTRRGWQHVHRGLALPHKPYYALWAYKEDASERFDLLGNSLAILTGIASPTRARVLIHWIEDESQALRAHGELALPLPPSLFPYIRPGDPDWRTRYAQFNPPGQYHNGGVWPVVCGFYVAAAVAAGCQPIAQRALAALTALVRPARQAQTPYGFNEWLRAQDGAPCGQDWQTWSAAMYLYAAACVESRATPLFDEVRLRPQDPEGQAGGGLF